MQRDEGTTRYFKMLPAHLGVTCAREKERSEITLTILLYRDCFLEVLPRSGLESRRAQPWFA